MDVNEEFWGKVGELKGIIATGEVGEEELLKGIAALMEPLVLAEAGRQDFPTHCGIARVLLQKLLCVMCGLEPDRVKVAVGGNRDVLTLKYCIGGDEGG